MPAGQPIFSLLIDRFAGTPGVSAPDRARGRGFGSSALQVDGSIFAMVAQDQLVLKLPKHRVESLIESGHGAPFDAGKGRPMKEWVTVTSDDDVYCLALASEALEFVRRRTG